MIRFIQGKLVEKHPTVAVVQVGGIGLEVFITLHTFNRLGPKGSEVSLLAYLHVREDLLQLFGFADEVERRFFVMLIGVSGIGPKSALGILSKSTAQDLSRAIRAEQVDLLTSLPGVGRKTAQRLVLELRDRLKAGVDESAGAPGGAASTAHDLAGETILAMLSLGYSRAEAVKSVQRAISDADPADTVETLLKKALAKGG